jgi:hypothetical protein
MCLGREEAMKIHGAGVRLFVLVSSATLFGGCTQNTESCDAGYQDNDGDGTCEPDCTSSSIDCSGNGACDDSSGVAACACDPGWGGADCSAETLPAEADGVWKWVPLEGALCRDGSGTGVSVNYSSTSSDLVIYLEAGGYCFDIESCSVNPDSVRTVDRFHQPTGIFDRTEPDNPVGDWNIVYVPYCTGDVHSGSKPDGFVEGVGAQIFVGGDNYRLFLDRIVPTFPDAQTVLLTGFSAGGLGAVLNAVATAEAFGTPT